MKLEAMDACEFVGSAQVYRAADVDALLDKMRGLTCRAEGWEADEDIIVVHGVGIVGGTLSRRNSGAVERWFNGAIAEIVERLTKGGSGEAETDDHDGRVSARRDQGLLRR